MENLSFTDKCTIIDFNELSDALFFYFSKSHFYFSKAFDSNPQITINTN